MKQLNIRFLTFLIIALVAFFLGGASVSAKEETIGEYLDDSDITMKVKAAILNEPTLQSTEIKVETFEGIVQLSGFVNSKADINKAVEATRSVMGVKSVKNDLQIK